MAQEHRRKPSEQTQDNYLPDPPADGTPTPGTAAEQTSDLDSLLDEIDDVLEVNAEEFVQSFVQKGGQ